MDNVNNSNHIYIPAYIQTIFLIESLALSIVAYIHFHPLRVFSHYKPFLSMVALYKNKTTKDKNMEKRIKRKRPKRTEVEAYNSLQNTWQS